MAEMWAGQQADDGEAAAGRSVGTLLVLLLRLCGLVFGRFLLGLGLLVPGEEQGRGERRDDHSRR